MACFGCGNYCLGGVACDWFVWRKWLCVFEFGWLFMMIVCCDVVLGGFV